jgi:hypothetical protein
VASLVMQRNRPDQEPSKYPIESAQSGPPSTTSASSRQPSTPGLCSITSSRSRRLKTCRR